MRYRRLVRTCESCGHRQPLDEMTMVEWCHPSMVRGVFLRLCEPCLDSFWAYHQAVHVNSDLPEVVALHSP